MEAAPELHYPGGVHDVSTTCEAPKGGIRSDPRNPACQYGEGVLPYCHLLCWKLTLFGMDAFLFWNLPGKQNQLSIVDKKNLWLHLLAYTHRLAVFYCEIGVVVKWVVSENFIH